MRFKVKVEFIQRTDPSDFKITGKKTSKKISEAIMKEYLKYGIKDSVIFAEEQDTLKVISVEYLDDET